MGCRAGAVDPGRRHHDRKLHTAFIGVLLCTERHPMHEVAGTGLTAAACRQVTRRIHRAGNGGMCHKYHHLIALTIDCSRTSAPLAVW